MPIEFRCPNCERLLSTADDREGMAANCPECGGPVRVPYLDELASDRPVEWLGNEDFEEQPRSARAGVKTCPMCGEQIKAVAVRCRFCGEALDRPYARPDGAAGYLRGHRGGMILAFGVLGWVVCFPFGIAAWVMGNEDLRQIRDGVMDPSGEGLTQAGRILGMVQCILLMLGMLLFCVFGGLGAVF